MFWVFRLQTRWENKGKMPPQTKGLSLDLPLICRLGRRPATWGAEAERGEGGGGGVVY